MDVYQTGFAAAAIPRETRSIGAVHMIDLAAATGAGLASADLSPNVLSAIASFGTHAS